MSHQKTGQEKKRKYSLRKLVTQQSTLPFQNIKPKNRVRNVTCIRSFNRTTECSPNNAKDNLNDYIDDEDSFLKNQSLQNSLRKGMLSPRHSLEGDVLNRSIVGTRDMYLQTNQTRLHSPADSSLRPQYLRPQHTLTKRTPLDNSRVAHQKDRQATANSSSINNRYVTSSRKQKRFYGISLNDKELQRLVDEVKERSIEDLNSSQQRFKSISLHNRLQETRGERMLSNYDKHRRYWNDSISRLNQARNKKSVNGEETRPKYKPNKNYQDISVFERSEEYLQKRQDQGLLEVAYPSEMQYGQSSWYWSLRNSPTNAESNKERLNTFTQGKGNQARETFRKKIPDTQPEVIGKPSQFKLTGRLQGDTHNSSVMTDAGRSSGFMKTFIKLPSISKKLNRERERIEKCRPCPTDIDFDQMQLAGLSKLEAEIQHARSIDPQKRRLILGKRIDPNSQAQSSEKQAVTMQDECSPDEVIAKKFDRNHLYFS